jgi:hypothetical protein
LWNLVLPVDVCPKTDQHRGSILMSILRSEVQRRVSTLTFSMVNNAESLMMNLALAYIGSGIDVRPNTDQQRDNALMSFLSSGVQRCVSILRFSAIIISHSENVTINSSLAYIVGGIDVHPKTDQQCDSILASFLSSEVQRFASTLTFSMVSNAENLRMNSPQAYIVGGIDVRPKLDQQLDGILASFESSEVQRRPSILTFSMHMVNNEENLRMNSSLA